MMIHDSNNTIEDVRWPICCHPKMFEYIMKNVEWVEVNESVLKKMKRHFDGLLNGEAQVKIIEETMKRMEGQWSFRGGL